MPNRFKTPGRSRTRPAFVVLAAWLAASPASAADPARLEHFEKHVRPLLVEHCQSCHGPSKQKGGLRLDSIDAIRKGGDNGPAVVPGKPAESLLVQAVRYAPDQDLKMPPKGKLPEAAAAALAKWVSDGAEWPATDVAQASGAKEKAAPKGFTPEQRAFWAFRKAAEPKVPAVKDANWARSPLDVFILARLEAKGLKPAPKADKRTLIRRATFDLIGLPPTPEEVERFLKDESPDAFAKVVDRLLASPRHGERWGRHWLDVARYADSNGMDENVAMSNAWRYRDYVVRAFNSDLPYDQFVREQIAGDLLPELADEARKADRLIATGFLSVGPKMLAEDDPVKMEMDIIDEQVESVGRSFLGLTIGCARCHDHKFDPIPTADYYGLAGIFKSTRTMANHKVVAMWHERPLTSKADKPKVDALNKQIADKAAETRKLTQDARKALQTESRERIADYLIVGELLERRQAAFQALGNAPLAAVAKDAIVVEAENFTRGNVIKDTTNYGKGIGIVLNGGPMPNRAEYEITIPRAGVYQFEIRQAAQEARPVKVTWNGRLIKSDALSKPTGTWFAESQAWSVEAVEALPAGKLTVVLERDGPFPHIDKLALVPRPLPAGLALADFSSPDEQIQTRKLNRNLLDRWVRAIARARKAPAGNVLAAWVGSAPKPTEDWKTSPGEVDRILFATPLPWTRRDLAARYQQLLTRDRKNVSNLASVRSFLDDPDGPLTLPRPVDPLFPPETVAKLAALKAEQTALEAKAAAFPLAMAVEDREVKDLAVHIRGNHMTLGEVVPRRFPRILAGESQAPLPKAVSGRKELADWLTRPDNPLTARVMVNRLWRWHFGEGLVRSVDNFGTLGERPDQPEVLDWLALRFVEAGWSMKALHRTIMLSSAYQMSTALNEKAALLDPDNRLLWRMNRRRLEAESVRDTLLALGGTIDFQQGGTLLTTRNHEYVYSTASALVAGQFQSNRRSVYLPVVRSGVYDALQVFDFADPSVGNGSRSTTTVAPQALFMLNSEIIAGASRGLAKRILSRAEPDDARVRRLFSIAFGRPPAEPEISRTLEFLDRYQATLAVKNVPEPDRRPRAWQGLCHAVLASSETITVD